MVKVAHKSGRCLAAQNISKMYLAAAAADETVRSRHSCGTVTPSLEAESGDWKVCIFVFFLRTCMYA